jgi:hypothetical protein
MSIMLGQPYSPSLGNYTPQVLDSHPVRVRQGRIVFGYRPLFLRSYLWGWGGGYYGRPYGWAF